MARSITSANLAALQGRLLVARDYLWIVARDRETDEPVSVGFWSDLGNVTAQVRDPLTGNAVTRAFYGAGGLIGIDDIPAVSSLTVQSITIRMSQLDDLVAQAVRLYDIRQARVEIFRGLFDPDSRALVDPAECRFVGFIDGAPITTGSEGEEGGVLLTCVSHTQEMTRSNPETRSHEYQKLRAANDDFFVDASVVSEWEHSWGRAAGKIQTQPKRQGLFGWGNFLGFL